MDPERAPEAAAELPEHSVEADPVPAVVEPQTAEASGTSTAPVSFEGELQRAKAIFRNGKEAVRSMFQEVRLGKAPGQRGPARSGRGYNRSLARNPHALLSVARIKHKDEYTYLHSVAWPR
ncbi:DUF3391 domain-containing protein [Halopseudomonas pachastrellae]|nr:DUF3391 domain-containing protein [Halopseudomonas pachastrellae]